MVLKVYPSTISIKFSVFFKNKILGPAPRYFYFNSGRARGVSLSLKKKKVFSTTLIRGFNGPKSTFRRVAVCAYVGSLEMFLGVGVVCHRSVTPLLVTAILVVFFSVASLTIKTESLFIKSLSNLTKASCALTKEEVALIKFLGNKTAVGSLDRAAGACKKFGFRVVSFKLNLFATANANFV